MWIAGKQCDPSLTRADLTFSVVKYLLDILPLCTRKHVSVAALSSEISAVLKDRHAQQLTEANYTVQDSSAQNNDVETPKILGHVSF